MARPRTFGVSKTKRGDSWYLGWNDPDTNRFVRLSLGRITEEQAERARKIAELERATGVAVSNKEVEEINRGPTLADFFESQYKPWHNTQYPASRKKVDNVMRAVLKRFGSVALVEIRPKHVEEWKAGRMSARMAHGRTISMGTLQAEFNQFRATLRKAVQWGLIPSNPFGAVEAVPKGDDPLPRQLSREELERICSADPRSAPYWRFMANTGLRRQEFQHLRWSDVRSLPDGSTVIHVVSMMSRGTRTKSGKTRTVPCNQSALAALAAIRAAGADAELIARPMLPRSFSRLFERAAERARVDARLHDLRHTFGCHLAEAGVPIHTIKELMGHASITTTQIYLHYSHDSAKSAVSSINL